MEFGSGQTGQIRQSDSQIGFGELRSFWSNLACELTTFSAIKHFQPKLFAQNEEFLSIFAREDGPWSWVSRKLAKIYRDNN